MEKDMDYCDLRGIDNESKYVLWPLRYYSEKYLGQYLSKPLFTCIPCMSSVWGTAGYLVTHGLSKDMVYQWPIYILVLAGLGTIAQKITNGVD